MSRWYAASDVGIGLLLGAFFLGLLADIVMLAVCFYQLWSLR